MNKEEVVNRIKTLIKLAKLSEEESKELMGKLETSEEEQLDRLHDNLLNQIAANLMFEFLDELDNDNRLLDEEDISELMQKLKSKFDQSGHELYTESELKQVRAHLDTLQQNMVQNVQQAQLTTVPAAPAVPAQPVASAPVSIAPASPTTPVV